MGPFSRRNVNEMNFSFGVKDCPHQPVSTASIRVRSTSDSRHASDGRVELRSVPGTDLSTCSNRSARMPVSRRSQGKDQYRLSRRIENDRPTRRSASSDTPTIVRSRTIKGPLGCRRTMLLCDADRVAAWIVEFHCSSMACVSP